MTKIWYEDPSVFIDSEQVLEFIPDQRMTFAEQLNAVMRFVLYFTIIVLIFKQDVRVVYFLVFTGLVTWLLYSFEDKKNKEKKELLEELCLKQERHHPNKYCTKPTKNNPFMNVLMNEYREFPNRPKACDIQKNETKRQVKKLFDASAYRDVDDIFHRNTNDRQFYTTPATTIPNDQMEFAKWLYKTSSTCKENAGTCLI